MEPILQFPETILQFPELSLKSTETEHKRKRISNYRVERVRGHRLNSPTTDTKHDPKVNFPKEKDGKLASHLVAAAKEMTIIDYTAKEPLKYSVHLVGRAAGAS